MTSRRQRGSIITRYGARLELEDAAGTRHGCTSRKKLGAIVCGDRVQWQSSDDGTCVVVALEPRRTLLSRPDASGRLRPMAANIDQIVVVAAPVPGLDEDLIDRYLVAAEVLGIRPVILLNKSDLLDEAARTRLAVYADIGYEVLYTTTKRDNGLEPLIAHLAGRISILVGQSGVGKSSIVRMLMPETEVRVGGVSGATGLGRHTTSATRLYHLPHGGDLIDSPGVREFGLWGIDPGQLAQGFLEFHPYLGHCRFNDCRHRIEPGCAVLAAAHQGSIPPRRLESYHRILADLP